MDFLVALVKATPEQQHYHLCNLSDDQARILQDVVRNFLLGSITVSDENYAHLQALEPDFVSLSHKRVGKRRLVRLLQQTGSGVISILLPVLLSSVLGNLIR